jgi:hypothetical protein
MMRKTLMALLLLAVAMVTSAAAQQQALTPFQQTVIRGIKKVLTETIESLHRYLDALDDPAAAAALSQMDRLDVLDEVLRDWTDTPAYASYAANVMDWQNHLGMTIADLAADYERQHGALDSGFEKELRHRIVTNPAYSPPAEYLNRHLCGVPDCLSLK